MKIKIINVAKTSILTPKSINEGNDIIDAIEHSLQNPKENKLIIYNNENEITYFTSDYLINSLIVITK
jgi:hypothetical protein